MWSFLSLWMIISLCFCYELDEAMVFILILLIHIETILNFCVVNKF